MDRMKNSHVWGIVSVLMIVTLTLAACAPTAATPTTAPSGPVVNAFGVELPADAAPPDQQIQRGATFEGKHFDTMRHEYEGFAYEATIETLAIMDANGDWLPAAADSWEVSEDGRTRTFHLRQGAKWSDGTPITAEDWVYSFRRYVDPDMANVYAWFLYAIENAEAVSKGELPLDDLGVKKIDDYTFSVTTTISLPYYMFTLNWHTAPVPMHMVEEYGDAWADNPETAPSNGPYRILEWNRGKDVIFGPNPYYDGPWKPYIEKIIWTIVPQGYQQYLQMYMAGDLDSTGGIRGDQLAQTIDDPELGEQVYVSADPRTAYLYMNMYREPFDNLLVRQAFMHAVDRESLCDNVMRGTCVAGYGLLPVDFPCTQNDNPELRALQSFDPELAKQLLAEAGYPGGVGFPAVTLITRAGEFAREAEAAQRMLQDNLEISVKIQDIERATFGDLRDKHELDFALTRWGADFLDPSNFFDWWDDPEFNNFVNPEFTALIDEARPMPDQVNRCGVYHQAEMILAEEGPAVFLLYPKIGSLYQPYIGGLPEGMISPTDMTLRYRLYVKEH